MSRTGVEDLTDQYKRAFWMLYEEIGRFDDREWTRGLTDFMRPVGVASHLLDALDYYFSGLPGEKYHWGHQFGGGWWELPDNRQPDREAVLQYARELETRVMTELAGRCDEDLLLPFTLDDSARTWLGHYVYALRHTMHHHGELSALLTLAGEESGSWA
jgi:uncharacterized damage-inducible protein DinB